MSWKAVTQELPDDDTTVLLYAPDGFDPVFVGSKDGDSWIDQNGLEYGADQITHWMKFPDPPMNDAAEREAMGFNDWYETYERDGGELMLFNTIDLEAAFNAGNRAAEREEECMERERLACIEIRQQAAWEALKIVNMCGNQFAAINEIKTHFGLEG